MAVVKMINNKSQSIQGLICVIAYACKDAKTNHDGQQLITGINCVPSLAFDEFMTTKRLYNQDGGRMFYHMVQSFSPEENITPEAAHEIACKLADAIPGFEIVVATHCDADHVHSHFVINSVSSKPERNITAIRNPFKRCGMHPTNFVCSTACL